MDRERIHALVELLPPAELVAAERFLSFLVAQAGWVAESAPRVDRTPVASPEEGTPAHEPSVPAPLGSAGPPAGEPRPEPATGAAEPFSGPTAREDGAITSDAADLPNPTAAPRPTEDRPPGPPPAEALASGRPLPATRVEHAPAGDGWPSMEPSVEVSA